MSYGELKGFKDNFGYGMSLIKIKTSDSQFYGKTVDLKKNGSVIASGTVSSDTGECRLLTDESGKLEVKCVGTNSTYDKFITVTYYGTYNVELTGLFNYTFRVAKATQDSKARVEYTGENANFTPAYMDYGAGTFNYGSWENAFFMPKSCMLKNDGSVDYYLDEDDNAKKLDGTASDIENTGYAGNAMVEFPKIWLYQDEDANYEYYGVANYQVNGSYNDYAYHDKNSVARDHFYMAKYEGSYISGALRSLSNQTPGNTQTGTTEIGYINAAMKSNGWYTGLWSHRNLVSVLLKLMSKSTDVQTAFGRGHDSGGSGAGDLQKSGLMNTRGLFWGDQSGSNGVKVFGIEHFWGNRWERIAGLTTSNQNIYAKMTYGTEDGTTSTGWQTSTSGYKNMGIAMSGTSGNCISLSKNTSFGSFPVQMNGGTGYNIYDCDGVWFGTSVAGYALVGGACGDGLGCGLAVLLSYAVSYSGWSFGASLSCIQPA